MGETGRGEGSAPLFEREWLEESIEVILGGGAGAADELARLLDGFRYALDGGLSGIEEARAGLVAALELVYLRTGAHASALRLYGLWLEGRVRPGDEPCVLLEGAIGRCAEGVRGARGRGKG